MVGNGNIESNIKKIQTVKSVFRVKGSYCVKNSIKCDVIV